MPGFSEPVGPARVVFLGFVAGLSLLVACLNVLLRDVEHILTAALLPWFFLTPILWGATNLPASSQKHHLLLAVLRWWTPVAPAALAPPVADEIAGPSPMPDGLNWPMYLGPVAEDIARYLPATLELISASLLLALLIGIPLGVYAGVKRGRWPDHATRLLSVGGVALPSFWFAIVLQMVFVGELHWLPTSGRFSVDLAITSPIHTITGFLTIDSLLQGNLLRFGDAIAHLILPAVTLALYPIGLVARMVRTMMIEVLGENYVRTAKAYGLPARFIHYRYALKNAISPAIVAVGLSFAYELTGAFLIENIFSWNGIGQYAFNAVLNFDYPAVLGTTIVVAIFLPFVLAYTAWTYYVFRRRVSDKDFRIQQTAH